MPKFRFAVRSPEGKLRTGTVTEATLEAAKDRLKNAGFLIVTLAEETELVIHEAKSPTGTAHVKTERAAIIEFELSFTERLSAFLHRFILRKEFALLLLLLGTPLAGYGYLHRPKAAPVAEAKYIAFDVEVTVDPGSSQGDLYEVLLPDIPLRFTAKKADGTILKSSFEAVKQPGRVLVRLIHEGKLVAEGEGLLSARKQGLLAGQVALTPAKKKGT